MASDDIKKLVKELMPGFEAVERPKRTGRRAAPPDQESRPASAWNKKPGDRPARDTSPETRSAARRRDAPASRSDPGQPPPSSAASRDDFFGSGDPRERLRKRAEKRPRPDATTDDDQKTVIVEVRPTDAAPDNRGRPAAPKAVVVKGKKIVGFQG